MKKIQAVQEYNSAKNCPSNLILLDICNPNDLLLVDKESEWLRNYSFIPYIFADPPPSRSQRLWRTLMTQNQGRQALPLTAQVWCECGLGSALLQQERFPGLMDCSPEMWPGPEQICVQLGRWSLPLEILFLVFTDAPMTKTEYKSLTCPLLNTFLPYQPNNRALQLVQCLGECKPENYKRQGCLLCVCSHSMISSESQAF